MRRLYPPAPQREKAGEGQLNRPSLAFSGREWGRHPKGFVLHSRLRKTPGAAQRQDAGMGSSMPPCDLGVGAVSFAGTLPVARGRFVGTLRF